jgi:hypothetical protein
MGFGVGIVEIASLFSKGLHHRAGIADLGRRLAGQGEAELVTQQVVDLLGLGVAFHPQFAAVGGRDGHGDGHWQLHDL